MTDACLSSAAYWLYCVSYVSAISVGRDARVEAHAAAHAAAGGAGGAAGTAADADADDVVWSDKGAAACPSSAGAVTGAEADTAHPVAALPVVVAHV